MRAAERYRQSMDGDNPLAHSRLVLINGQQFSFSILN